MRAHAEAHAAVRAGTEEHAREGWKKKPRELGDRPEPREDELADLNDELLTVPEGFTVHPKLANQLERRAPRSTRAASTGATPSRSRSRRCCGTACRSG